MKLFTKKDEALKMAMEQMEVEGIGGCKAYEACKEALQQPIYTQEIMQQFIDNAILTSNLPKRSWQGLTDEEIKEIDDVTLGDYYVEKQATEFAKAIEKKLKDKNTLFL
jgi:hypothetical protein